MFLGGFRPVRPNELVCSICSHQVRWVYSSEQLEKAIQDGTKKNKKKLGHVFYLFFSTGCYSFDQREKEKRKRKEEKKKRKRKIKRTRKGEGKARKAKEIGRSESRQMRKEEP